MVCLCSAGWLVTYKNNDKLWEPSVVSVSRSLRAVQSFHARRYGPHVWHSCECCFDSSYAQFGGACDYEHLCVCVWLRSPAVDEEERWRRPGRWLASMLCVSSSASTVCWVTGKTSVPEKPVMFIMVALCNRAHRYIFALWFLSFFFLFFFPRLISAIGYWISTILPHVVWP